MLIHVIPSGGKRLQLMLEWMTGNLWGVKPSNLTLKTMAYTNHKFPVTEHTPVPSVGKLAILYVG